MKNLLIIFLCSILVIGCKKEQSLSAKTITNRGIAKDTIKVADKNQVIFINASLPFIDSLKNSYKNKDDFYTIADDANFYTAEAGRYVIKNMTDTININNNKILKIGKNIFPLSKYKPWTLLLYKKGQKQLHSIFPIDIEKEFNSYYSMNEKKQSNTIEQILSKNKFNSLDILFKNEYDFNDDGFKDYIIILQNPDKNKRTIMLIENKNNKYFLVFANNSAIPCEDCGNGAESFYNYKIENIFLKFDSSYKSNDDIYKLHFEFKNEKNSYLLNKVIVVHSIIGENIENETVLDRNKFNEINLQTFNFIDFVSNYILT